MVLLMILMFFICNESIIAQKKTKLNKYTFGEVFARHIGPAAMSGRISCIDAVENDSRIIYVGAASGGIWKSTTSKRIGTI